MKKKEYKPDAEYGFVDVEGACKILGVSRSWIYKATASRKLCHFKVGAKLLFKVAGLLEFIEKNKYESV